MKTYFNNQLDTAMAITGLMDNYRFEKISEEALQNSLKEIFEKNKEYIFKENDYNITIKKRVGQRRLVLIEKIFDRIGFVMHSK